MSAWSVILPEESTNMVLNPIAMDSGNYAVIGAATATIGTVTGYAYYGYKYFRVQTTLDNTGAYWSLNTLSNAIHYITMRVHTASDITPMFDCSLDNVNWTTPTLLYTEGVWYVYGAQMPAAQASGSTILRVQQNGAGTNNFYVGHLQIEAKEYPTTPITGDRAGFTKHGYYWNGEAHVSSSTRAANERSGGVVVDLETSYNFKVLYGLGAGMPPIKHHVQNSALLPGASYQGSKVRPRVLDLYSTTVYGSAANVSAARRDFINATKPDRVSPVQPVVFRYTGANANKPVEFHGYYDSGMEFQTTGQVVDQPSARFICYDPYAYEVHTQGVALGTLASIANADYIVRRTGGTWENISTQFNNIVWALVRGPDGCVYIGGAFTDVVSASGDRVLKWNPNTEVLWVLGTGTDGTVYDLCATKEHIFATGGFANAGGTAVNYIARWNISGATWYALTGASGTGLNSAGSCLTYGHDGNLYIGGTFTLAGGVANTSRIAYWDKLDFHPLGTGMNGTVDAIAIAPNGDIYATGTFTTAGGVSAVRIAKWDGSAWSALSTGLTGLGDAGYALAFDEAGNLFVGGSFNTAGGISCSCVAKWNGKTFEPLGSGLNGLCRKLAFDNNGLLYAGGSFSTAGGIDPADSLAVWNGSSWAHLDIDFPGSSSANAILPVGDYLYIGYDTSGTAYSSSNTPITNSGSATAYPKITIYRALDGTNAHVMYLKNNTTGATIWLDYYLVEGETLALDFAQGKESITSDVFGNVWYAVLRGGDMAEFSFLPGVNNISLMISNDATITAWAEWDITHWGADMVAA